jgi:hypothetical protein
MATSPIIIDSLPGIKRDGTRMDGDQYIDGQWVRFVGSKPRKIPGYRKLSDLTEKVYGMNSYTSQDTNYIHLGSASKFIQTRVPINSITTVTIDRTPLALVANPGNFWQIDFLPEATGGGLDFLRVLAHAAPNLDIASEDNQPIWIGTVSDNAALVSTGLDPVSGGIVVLGPYLVSYGNAGEVLWSEPNVPTTPRGSAFITAQKIVKGLPLRGTGSGPAGILWSLDSLIRMSFSNDLATDWTFDTLASDISILSPSSVIEYNGMYYWVGVDRFLMYNGVIREVPNSLNSDYFFENLNYDYRAKVFAFKVTRFGEIWWCYPRGVSTECTHAIIYNIRENTWYDTELPDDGRTSGLYAKVAKRPYLTGIQDEHFGLWEHETGTDRVEGNDLQPIQSYYETSEISMVKNPQAASSQAIRVERIEPDFVQSGSMSLTIVGRSNPRAPTVISPPMTFQAVASTPEEETLKAREIRRYCSFRFESYTLGGDYRAGQTIAHIAPSDGRIES